MQKSAKIALIACVVVVLGGGFAFYWFVLRDTAPPEATLQTEETTDGGPDTPDGTWTAEVGDDADAFFVGYRVEELFGGEAIKKEAAGRTSDVTGSLTIEGTTISEATFTADMTTLASDESRRDNVASGASVLNVAEFPEATFELTEPIDLGSVPEKGETVTVSATGDLTVKGVTQSVTFDLEASWSGAVINVAGSTPVLFSDFDIAQPQSGFVNVDDAGTIELQLRFVPA